MIRWFVCSAVLGFVAASGVFAAPIALAALEGDVTVTRDGVVIPSEKIAEGFALEDFDTVTTGRTGRADVRFAASTGMSASVRLDAETSLYVDASPQKTEQTVGIELLAGGVSVQAASVAGRSLIDVRTDGGSFSQAGPGFRVVTVPSGESLIWTRFGTVAVRVGNRVISAEPGAVVEVSSRVKTVPVNVSTVDAYEAEWRTQKFQHFHDDAAGLLHSLGTRYQLQLVQFERAWERGQREAGGPQRSVQAAVADLRRSAAPLERSMPRIQALRQLFDDGLIPPAIEVNRGYSAKDFFKTWDQESADWALKLAEARAQYKAVVAANDGDFPRTSDLPEVTYSSDFFH